MGNCYNLAKTPDNHTLDTMIKSNKKIAELNNDVLKLDVQNDNESDMSKKVDGIQKSRKTNVTRTKDGTVVTTTVIHQSSNGYEDDDYGFDDHFNGLGKKNMFQKFEKEYEKYDKYDKYDKFEKDDKYNNVPKKNVINSNRNEIKESEDEDDEDDDYQQEKINGKGNTAKPNLQEFINEALKTHNDLRSKHLSPSLKLNKDLNQIAQKYAEKIARSNNFAHSDNEYKGDPLGENLYMCGGYKITGKEMSQAWYNEIKDYDFKRGAPSSGTGHFTQLIWADSKEVGFGFAKAKDGSYYGVANYYPAGNYQGEYLDNVKQKRS